MGNINVSGYVVRNAGQVDIEATVEKFRGELSSYLAQYETEQASIADAVHSVFDKHLGTTLTMPVLSTYSLNELNAQPENYTALNDRVLDYVRQNAEGDSSIFVISKGKGGGVKRRVDIPAPAAK